MPIQMLEELVKNGAKITNITKKEYRGGPIRGVTLEFDFGTNKKQQNICNRLLVTGEVRARTQHRLSASAKFSGNKPSIFFEGLIPKTQELVQTIHDKAQNMKS